MTASVLLEWTVGATSVALEIDCAEEQAFESSCEVTEHPVEQGSNISDHVRPQPDTVKLTGWITNQPIVPTTDMPDGKVRTQTATVAGKTVKFQALSWDTPVDRAGVADQLLLAAKDAGALVRYTSTLRTLEDLVLTSYQVSRKAETGDSLPIVLELRKLRIVSTERVAVTATRQRRGQRARDRGAQPTTTPAGQRRSALRQLGGAVVRAFGG